LKKRSERVPFFISELIAHRFEAGMLVYSDLEALEPHARRVLQEKPGIDQLETIASDRRPIFGDPWKAAWTLCAKSPARRRSNTV
jgi:hypothetical protein